MKLFSLPNLSSHITSITDDVTLSTTPNPRPVGQSKEQFRAWCAAATTQGAFISPWEGISQTSRIATNNPPALLHGIIADYDSTGAMGKIQDLPNRVGLLPTWVAETFTQGKCRLIWVFEKPVNVLHPEVTERFLKELDGKLKISDALPGFDKCSWNVSQYFELGTKWHSIQGGVPVPSSLLEQCIMEGGIKAKVQFTDDPAIPMDVIALEVEKQFPGRWKKAFEEGQRGPLFWIADGIDREGCVVTQNGMICYSDRAASTFMPWRAVLGKKFVEQFEQEVTGKAAETFYFDGRVYWTSSHTAKWTHLQKEDVRMHLRDLGCSERPRKGQNSSDLEKVLIHVQKHRRVDGAVPVLFNPEETVSINGNRYLNTSTTQVMQPAENGDPSLWPWLHDYFNNAFDGDMDGVPARDFLFGWLRRWYKSSLEGKPNPGQVMIMAGEAHTGKTLINRCVFGFAMGGSIDAEPILMRKTDFNKQGATVALWRCDDAASEGDWQTRQLFAKSLKAMAANPTQRYHPKGFDSIEIPFKGRVCVTCNTDPESLRALPTLDGTIRDKIMLFKIRDGWRPQFFENNYENEARVLQELPHFLRWLLDWTPPKEILDPVYKRFEIKSFHHPELTHSAQAESPESIFSEYLEGWIEAKRSTSTVVLKLTVTKIHSELTLLHTDYPYKVNQTAAHLKKLLAQNMVPELTDHIKPKNRSTYVFKIPPEK